MQCLTNKVVKSSELRVDFVKLMFPLVKAPQHNDVCPSFLTQLFFQGMFHLSSLVNALSDFTSGLLSLAAKKIKQSQKICRLLKIGICDRVTEGVAEEQAEGVVKGVLDTLSDGDT